MAAIARLKRQVLETLLVEADFVLVVVNPLGEGVTLPDDLRATRRPVGLNIGHRMNIPIPDLQIDDEGIRGTLSFNRTPFHCRIPWRAVLQLSLEEEHLVWVEPPADRSPDDEGEPPAERRRGRHLKLV